MNTVGQIEKRTQARVVALLRDRLHYTYLDNWIDRAGNTNIESERLTAWFASRGVASALASRALFELQGTHKGDEQAMLDDIGAIAGMERMAIIHCDSES